ncbi:hypothetical protein ACWEIK_22120 [Streptomyces sp. NPDC004673]
MLHRIRRRATKSSEGQREFLELSAQLESQLPREVIQVRAELEPAESSATVDGFLPPELRVLSHDQLDGRMMPWKQPLALGDELVACQECGAYRDWLILSTRDQIWLRCRAGHQQQEPRLDTAWFNRNSGPADATYATFEECLHHHGH